MKTMRSGSVTLIYGLLAIAAIAYVNGAACKAGNSTAVLRLASKASYASILAGNSGLYSEAPFVGRSENKTCGLRGDVLLIVNLKPAEAPGKAAQLCLWWLGNIASYCEGAAQLEPVCLDMQPDRTWGAKSQSTISGHTGRQSFTGHTLRLLDNGQFEYKTVTYSSSSFWEVGGWESFYSSFDVRLRVLEGCLFNTTLCNSKRTPGSTYTCQGCSSCTSGRRTVCPDDHFRSETHTGVCLPCKEGYTSPIGTTKSQGCLPVSDKAASIYANSWKCITNRIDSRLGEFQGTPFRWNGFNPECPSLDGKHCLRDRFANTTDGYLKSCQQVLKELPMLRSKKLLRAVPCGGRHEQLWGHTGYDYDASNGPGHWCNVAWEEFVGYQVGKDGYYNCVDCSKDAPVGAVEMRSYIDVMAITPASAPALPTGFGIDDNTNGGGGGGGSGGGDGDTPGGYGAGAGDTGVTDGAGDSSTPGGYSM
jgi:hypothetical protein